MPTIVKEPLKQVPNLAPLVRNPDQNSQELSNLKSPFRGYGPKVFGELNIKLQDKAEIKLPTPGEGLPRVIHYCADQSGCAFWRLLWPSEELLAHNKAVVMTLYQMVTIGQFYGGIDAVRLQRQCTEPQIEFIRFLRKVSDDLKSQTGKGFRIIYEVDDLVYADLVPKYNVCGDAFQDPKIEKNVKEALHLCVDKDTLVFCILDGQAVDITVEEIKEHFDQGRNVKVLSKDINTGIISFKELDNCWITSENAEVIQIIDDLTGYELICTPDHPIYTRNRGWIEAGKLEPSDILDTD